jgi:hypothetical protein
MPPPRDAVENIPIDPSKYESFHPLFISMLRAISPWNESPRELTTRKRETLDSQMVSDLTCPRRGQPWQKP